MVPFQMTLSDPWARFQDHAIQRKITQKWYKRAILTTADRQKVVYGLSNDATTPVYINAVNSLVLNYLAPCCTNA